MIVAIIPARAGSKGFKNKNIAEIQGKTLIEYAVLSGLKASLISEVFISTDSIEYEAKAIDSGASSLGLRPEILSTDNAKSIDVIIDLLTKPEMRDVTHVVLLQPTSPIRSKQLIDSCIQQCIKGNESVVTVSKIEDPHPVKLKKIDNSILRPYLEGGNSEVTRQELPSVYELTGAVYVSSVENILKEKSFFSSNTIPVVCNDFVNIDNERDFNFLKFLVHENLVKFD